MRRINRLLPLVVIIVLMLTTVGLNTQAQTSGGVIIEGNGGGDPKTFNPIFVSDTASQRITGFLFPTLIAVDPKTADYLPNGAGGVAEKWDVSTDSITYTFHLRQAYKWTDGAPLTAKDFQYAYDAIVSGKVKSRYTGDAKQYIASYKALDDYTLEVKFKEANCKALGFANNIPPLPMQLFKPDFSDLTDSPFNTKPNVTAGTFKFKELRPSEQVTLLANKDYPDVKAGSVKPEGFIYKVIPDQNVLVEQFLAGETNVIDNPQTSRRSDIDKAQTDGKVTVFKYPGNSWEYVAFNLADPAHPQSAFDKDGKPIDQGHHPLFGDVRVRRALAMATNIDQVIKTAVFGEAQRIASSIIPSSWAYDTTLKPLPFDTAAAEKLLDEAGFPKNTDGVRVAKGAKYAPDGTPLKFTLYTNKGNTRREATGTIFQDNMKQIGVVVDFQPIDFNTLLDKQNAQTYDATLLGWRNGFPDDPDQTTLFTPSSDIVGSGLDFTSYNNPDVNKLELDALHVPGCALKDRAAVYAKIQKIIQDDQPYIFLFAINGEYAANKSVKGFNPFAAQLYWNVDSWTVNVTQ